MKHQKLRFVAQIKANNKLEKVKSSQKKKEKETK